MIKKLIFSKGNAKLGKTTAIFNLPAGHTCPAAKLCMSMVGRVTGKLVDGPHTQFRCYAANTETLFPNVRKSRWGNFDKLKGKSVVEMAELIQASLPKRNTVLVRIHSSGDFFSQDYFDAWLKVARDNPSLTFYAYTKMLPLWVRRVNSISSNFKLVASLGGKFDNLIEAHKLRHVRVVFSPLEAKRLGLVIDHDDTAAWKGDKNFALLLHGTQPAKSAASVAWQKIKTKGRGGYHSDYFGHYGK